MLRQLTTGSLFKPLTEGPRLMTDKAERETATQRIIRLRSEAQKLTDQRALITEQSEKSLDEMVRRSIDLHGA
jgi:hypothetical protein